MAVQRWYGQKVAPYTGAWIEIGNVGVDMNTKAVAPYTGAWIEITADYWSW